MLDATDQWYTKMDNGLTNAILFVDLKKAFDTIDHEILLGKLNRYGFSNQTVELFRNYNPGQKCLEPLVRIVIIYTTSLNN